MTNAEFQLIGRGVYTLREAHRFTGVPMRSIQRWAYGYKYLGRRGFQHSAPIVSSGIDVEGARVIDFGALLEVRFLNAFRKHGLSWKTIRRSAEAVIELLGKRYPISSRIFKTDGKQILAEIVRYVGDKQLLNLVKRQYEFEKVISPMLYAGVEFDDLDEPFRWWPLGTDRRVVIDPARAFGAPIIAKTRIPTSVLDGAARVEGSIEAAAEMYDVEFSAVEDAVEFERRYA
jgi:uncharacterized protein (DUF433 family)